MTFRRGSEGFFSKNWHWVVLGCSGLMLAGAVAAYITGADRDPEQEASAALSRLDTVKSKTDTGVKNIDMQSYARILKNVLSPRKLVEVDDSRGSYLVSNPRVYCAICQDPIPPAVEICTFCGKEQPKVVAAPVDTDGDGMTDEYEKKYSLDSTVDDRDKDNDNDGFSNYEEFLAKTDPSDKSSHPDYLDSLRLELPLVQTVMPFYFERVQPLRGNEFRFYFRNPSAKGAYGQKGLVYSVLRGQEIGKTGFKVKGYEEKKEKKSIEGTRNKMTREVDVSEATVERISDSREIVLRIGERAVSVDVQAKLVYDRSGIREFTVIEGDVIDLNGEKYKVKAITRNGNEVKVDLENVLTGKTSSLKALES